jgi:hypothetical protein
MAINPAVARNGRFRAGQAQGLDKNTNGVAETGKAIFAAVGGVSGFVEISKDF